MTDGVDRNWNNTEIGQVIDPSTGKKVGVVTGDETWDLLVEDVALVADEALALADEVEAIDDDLTAEKAKIARVDPGTTGTAGQSYARSPLTNLPKWFPRRYIVVDEVISDGGTIQDALNLVPASGADVVFRADGSSYTVPDAGLTVKAMTRIVPMGSRAAKLTAPSGATGTAVLTLQNSSGFFRSIVEGLDIDCNAHATMVNAIVVNANNTNYKDVKIVHSIVRNALGKGVSTWQSSGIYLDHLQAYNCYDAIYIDRPVGPSRLIAPYIVNTVAGRMRFGIRVTDNSTQNNESDVEIIAPYVDGATYATSNGSEAHGISINRAPRTKIIGGRAVRCGNPANRLGGGLVVAYSHGSSISDFHSTDNHGTGIWSELQPNADTSLGSAGEVRGAHFSNIHVIGNGAQGMSASYGAGTSITNLTAAMNGTEGIVWDCEGLILTNFRVFNNWQDSGVSAPVQNGGAKAGVRSYVGGGSIISNGHCYDNQAVKTQEYGLAVEQRGNLISNVITKDADHVTGGFTEAGGSTANTKTSIVT